VPERIKHAAVLAAVKARPLRVRASGKLCVPAGLDGVCARRPRRSAVGAGEACGAVEQRKLGGRGKHPSGGSGWVAGRGSAEEIELARILVGLGRDCFVVAADLVVVGVLKLERELHQGGAM